MQPGILREKKFYYSGKKVLLLKEKSSIGVSIKGGDFSLKNYYPQELFLKQMQI